MKKGLILLFKSKWASPIAFKVVPYNSVSIFVAIETLDFRIMIQFLAGVNPTLRASHII